MGVEPMTHGWQPCILPLKLLSQYAKPFLISHRIYLNVISLSYFNLKYKYLNNKFKREKICLNNKFKREKICLNFIETKKESLIQLLIRFMIYFFNE